MIPKLYNQEISMVLFIYSLNAHKNNIQQKPNDISRVIFNKILFDKDQL
jgi:hypothetical protein